MINPAFDCFFVHVELKSDSSRGGRTELEGFLPPPTLIEKPESESIARQRAIELPAMDPS